MLGIRGRCEGTGHVAVFDLGVDVCRFAGAVQRQGFGADQLPVGIIQIDSNRSLRPEDPVGTVDQIGLLRCDRDFLPVGRSCPCQKAFVNASSLPWLLVPTTRLFVLDYAQS